MDEVATMFSFNNWFDHFSYLLIAISYWLTDIFWLRLVAVVGLSFEILYFWHSGGDLRTGMLGPDLHHHQRLPALSPLARSPVAATAGGRSRSAAQRLYRPRRCTDCASAGRRRVLGSRRWHDAGR